MSQLQKIIYLTRQQYETLLSNNNTGQVTYGGVTLTGVQDNNIYFITDETVSATDLGDDFILPVSKGGTGKTSFTPNSLIVSGTSSTASLTTKTIATSITNDSNTLPNTAAVYNDALLKSGGTMTGALNLANYVLNTAGDDSYFGDFNVAGHFCVKGKNGNTGIHFTTYNQNTNTTGGKITWDGTKFNITSTTPINASISGNAGTATSAGKWTTARTITIGDTGKSVDGNENVSWSLADIGAAPAVTGGYLPLSGGIMTGNIRRYYSTASTEPLITALANNLDIYLWQVGHGTTAATNLGNNGYKLLYKGTNDSTNNYLQLIATQSNGTETIAAQWDELGNVNYKGQAHFDLGTTNTTAADRKFTIQGSSSNKLSLSSTGIQAYNSSNITSTLNLQYYGGTLEIGSTSTATAARNFYGTFDFKSSNGFTYSGISTASDDAARPIWFSYNGVTGRPVYNNDFKYNPSTNTLSIGTGTLSATNYSGNASTATTATNLSAAPTITAAGTATVNLAANTTYTLTVGGKSVIFKTPADSDTNTLMNYTLGATTRAYLMGSQNAPATSTVARAAHGDLGVYLTNVAGQLSAKSLSINDGAASAASVEKVWMQWNATDQALEFVFA